MSTPSAPTASIAIARSVVPASSPAACVTPPPSSGRHSLADSVVGMALRHRRSTVAVARRTRAPTAVADDDTEPAPRTRRYSTLGALAASGGALPTGALYLFRGPGVQVRVGLATERYRAGDVVEGTVVLVGDGEAGEAVQAAQLAGAHVEVALLCETARRKLNTSYRPGQQYRPQDIGGGRLFRYAYTRTLVPASHKWAQGPWEARYHHQVAPFMAPARAAVAPAATPTPSAGGRTATRRFRVRLPHDAPPSASWPDRNHGAHVDLRYRLVALVHLLGGSRTYTVMAETVVLVGAAQVRRELFLINTEREKSTLRCSFPIRSKLTLYFVESQVFFMVGGVVGTKGCIIQISFLGTNS